MANTRVPDERERRIIQANGMDPDRFAVLHGDDTSIRLLNFKTRDVVTIWKGDRKW